jgi:molybdopterin-guanine dinucleotide biosynthesis protein A
VADEREHGQVAAVLLAGGKASRLGGADKPGIRIRGRSLLAAVAAAASDAGASRLVVVGPERPGILAEFTSEEPAGAGPVPALRAGLARVSESWLLLLAADLPFLTGQHLRVLRTEARDAEAGALLIDGDSRPQWLVSCWRTEPVRAALSGYGGASLGGLLGPLWPAQVAIGHQPGEPPPWLDCDTSDDLAAAMALAEQDKKEGTR